MFTNFKICESLCCTPETCMYAKLLQSCLYPPHPRKAPLSMGFSRQEYWRWVLRPPPGELPDPGIKLPISCSSCTAGRFFTAELLGKPTPETYIIL